MATGARRPGVIAGATPARSTSTAWRKLTPWVRITQSMAEPPIWQAPMQCQRPLLGRDDERGGAVVVERAAADQVAPGLLQRHPRPDHQLGQVHLLFQPLDLLVRDAGHGLLLRKNWHW